MLFETPEPINGGYPYVHARRNVLIRVGSLRVVVWVRDAWNPYAWYLHPNRQVIGPSSFPTYFASAFPAGPSCTTAGAGQSCNFEGVGMYSALVKVKRKFQD